MDAYGIHIFGDAMTQITVWMPWHLATTLLDCRLLFTNSQTNITSEKRSQGTKSHDLLVKIGIL